MPGELTVLRLCVHLLITHTDCSWGRVFFIHTISQKLMQLLLTGTTKRAIKMFNQESWKPIYFGVKKSKVKVTRHKNTAG